MDLLTGAIIGAAIEVHRALGPGLLESACTPCFVHELELRGLQVRSEVAVPVRYKGVALDCGYRVDLIISESVVIELKAVEKLLPVHQAQVITYLKLTGLPVGLLIHWNVPLLKEGLKRLTNPSVTL
ncbi:MAG: GxxExxY protein [Planctomycetes bacterium]|nr:GxxExxY protein [Planctomycetota bacterium]MCW8134621.1 GxxExxY protein [Planctomycetota bacterium]